MESQMASQSGIPQDLENVDFDKELVTFSLLPDPPCNLNRNSTRNSTRNTGRNSTRNTGRNSAKNVVHLPPTSRQNRGSGGGP